MTAPRLRPLNLHRFDSEGVPASGLEGRGHSLKNEKGHLDHCPSTEVRKVMGKLLCHRHHLSELMFLVHISYAARSSRTKTTSRCRAVERGHQQKRGRGGG